jgi:hypothetical protein
MLLYAVIAVILFVIALYNGAISGVTSVDTTELFAQLTDALSGILQIITTEVGSNKLLLFGFWFIVGTAVYIFLWFITNILIDTYNNIVVSAAFVHPQSFHQSEYWAAILARVVLRVFAATALIAYIYFWIKALLPAWDYAYRASLSGLSLGGVINAIATAGMIVLTLHLCTILFRIVRLSRSNDEES